MRSTRSRPGGVLHRRPEICIGSRPTLPAYLSTNRRRRSGCDRPSADKDLLPPKEVQFRRPPTVGDKFACCEARRDQTILEVATVNAKVVGVAEHPGAV